MTYVLDASVLLKWFIEEPESLQALTYRSRLLEGKIVIACPDLRKTGDASFRDTSSCRFTWFFISLP